MAYCRKCGTKLDEGSRFCFNCGEAVETIKSSTVCPVCGKNNREGANYCRQCGKALKKSALPDPIAEELKSGAKSLVKQVIDKEFAASKNPGTMILSEWKSFSSKNLSK